MVDGCIRQVVILYSNNCRGICLGGLSVGRLIRGGCLSWFDCLQLLAALAIANTLIYHLATHIAKIWKLKLLSAIFHYFKKTNVFLCYFERSTLKRNLTYSCFFFPLFHEHLFSPGLPHATRLLETSCLEKITMCNRDNARDVAACPDE